MVSASATQWVEVSNVVLKDGKGKESHGFAAAEDGEGGGAKDGHGEGDVGRECACMEGNGKGWIREEAVDKTKQMGATGMENDDPGGKLFCFHSVLLEPNPCPATPRVSCDLTYDTHKSMKIHPPGNSITATMSHLTPSFPRLTASFLARCHD